jgi:hypothetical protein
MKSLWNSIDVSHQKIKEFGYVIFTVVGLIIPITGAYLNGFSITSTGIVLFLFGILFLGLCLRFQSFMDPVYRSWMLLALAMGFIMTRVIIAIVYYLMITPVGLIRRCSGSSTPKRIRASKKMHADTYWMTRAYVYNKDSTQQQF